MAGDWIKLRVDLQSHPKIVRILSALRADKFRVIGGLHAVWSVFDTHSVDGVLPGYTPEALDHVIGWDGFSGAMIDVGWLSVHEAGGLVMPEFDAHNGQSAKRRAEDQKRKRDGRKGPQSVRNLSANGADENGTREEKRREEIKENPPVVPQGGVNSSKGKSSITLAQLVAMGVQEKHAKDWLAVRKQKRAPLTETALEAVKAEAAKAGVTLAEAVRISAENSWQGFKATWLVNAQRSGFGAAPQNRQQQVEDANNRLLQEILAEEEARTGRINPGQQELMDLGGPHTFEGEVIHEP